MIVDLLGWFFYICLAWGIYLVSKKNSTGFLFRVVGDVGWFFLGIALSLSSVWFWSAVFAVLDSIAYYKWRNNAN